MFYMVSITIEHFRVVPSASSTGFSSLGLVTLTPGKKIYGTIMTHRGPGKIFLRHNYNSPGSGKKICGIITSIIVTVEHNLEHNSPFWRQCQKA